VDTARDRSRATIDASGCSGSGRCWKRPRLRSTILSCEPGAIRNAGYRAVSGHIRCAGSDPRDTSTAATRSESLAAKSTPASRRGAGFRVSDSAAEAEPCRAVRLAQSETGKAHGHAVAVGLEPCGQRAPWSEIAMKTAGQHTRKVLLSARLRLSASRSAFVTRRRGISSSTSRLTCTIEPARFRRPCHAPGASLPGRQLRLQHPLPSTTRSSSAV